VPSCSEVTARLSPLLDGRLDAPARAAVEGHVAACPDCAAELADLRRAEDALGADLPRLTLDPALVEATVARAAREGRPAGPWRTGLVLAAAAALLALAGAALWGRPASSGARPDDRAAAGGEDAGAADEPPAGEDAGGGDAPPAGDPDAAGVTSASSADVPATDGPEDAGSADADALRAIAGLVAGLDDPAATESAGDPRALMAAIEALEAADPEALPEAVRPHARARLARTRGDPAGAAAELEAYLAGDPDGPLRAAATLELARSRAAAGDDEGAAMAYLAVADHPSLGAASIAELRGVCGRLGPATLNGAPLAALPDAAVVAALDSNAVLEVPAREALTLFHLAEPGLVEVSLEDRLEDVVRVRAADPARYEVLRTRLRARRVGAVEEAAEAGVMGR